MFIFQFSLKADNPVYKICNLSGLILYRTSKRPSICKICKRLNGDYILSHTNKDEILVVKDENKPRLRDLMSRYRRTDYFYKKIYAILKINCYATDYKLIYKLLHLDARFIRFYLDCKLARMYKYLKATPECYQYLPAKLKNDKKYITSLFDKYINIGPYLSSKLLKDINIATKILDRDLSNINYLINVYDITIEFITWCKSIYPRIFCYIEPEYLFGLTQSQNGILYITRILVESSNDVLIRFYKYDMRATMGANIREILKNNPNDEWLRDYAPRHIRDVFSPRL